ncbi:uncharacterized protein LOC109726394 isoform X2 [Ananas comosus]|uniref:Uncharacterized protein LOC109726394 isoform X2 n=1 Tax=Ananas comosus TaxID=4615 RepID=A0A6P5H0V7_ANACO|nr:uncharacterized protein LOC109726394 isoform X2 [Ananas comosus]
MDKSWIRKSRLSKEYFDGVNDFLNFAFERSSQDGKILCPCSRCSNINWHTREVVKEHLVCNGFLRGYTRWACHGESISSSSSSSNTTYYLQDPLRLLESTPDQMGSSRNDDMEGLLRDALRMHFQDSDNSSSREDIPNAQNIRVESHEHCDIGLDRQEPTDEPNIGASNFYKLLEDAKQELYPGCTKFSKLSFIVHLFHLKCLNGWSSKSFTMLLELLNDAFPNGTSLPKSTYDAKKFIKDLGLGYEKINSCPNDCILYWGGRSNEQSCDVCGASRWLPTTTENINNDDLGNEERKGRPAKVLRYFPLIPRLQRLFMSPKTSDNMRWHDEGRTKDGLLRHPADSLAWRSFDSRYKDFSSDPRNVRLGLATDGFNLFRAMNTSYSMWPVILIPYNLPPWICMKQSSFILSMIIPGTKGPGNNIDVYLQPLIEELKQLWEGVDTYDASRKHNFRMRAALLWTISDFPAYANLSGWSTKGRYACPCCADKTCSRWLYNGKKFCYMGHRRWLSETHKFRYQKHLFDGTEEFRSTPTPISGTDVLKQVEGINFRYGKVPNSSRNKASTSMQSKKRVREQIDNSQDLDNQSYNLEAIGIDSDGDEDEDNFNNTSLWKKKSIFFMLPYWKYNLLRHNLDVMHIEKNVGENVFGTVLNEDGKSKDNMKARLDLVDMDIRHELHPQSLPNGRTYLPSACYLLSREEKEVFCKVLKDIKVPDGFASNISRCVNLKECRLLSLKSHDYHILMQDLLPLALRASMTTEVASTLIELSNIFKAICSKVLNVEDLEQLQHRAAITLCHLEKIFPPSFFTIMVHLVIHLPEEAKLGGPVHYRWMYPIERNLFRLKSNVRNKAHPEGSIAEGYLVEECLIFCSRYLEGVETRFNRPVRNYDTVDAKNKLTNCSGTSESSREDVIAMENKIYIEVIRKEYGGRVGGLGLIPSESCVCYNSESTEEVQKLREEVQENKKMVSQLQSQLAAVMEFIKQKIPDCNLGGSRQDPESSGTCYTSASSNPSRDT